MAENVRVVVRCRPMNKKEDDIGCKEIIKIEDCAVVIQNPSDLLAPPKTFTFDSAYPANAPTEALYNDICYALVENVLEGYNGTIFAYGQTGCGKSHTMQGPDNPVLVSAQRGIISRSFDHIFEAISVVSGVQFLALVSYLEIYNENIRDLLARNEGINANHSLKEIPGEGVTVPSLSSHAVHNAKECDELLRIGGKNRMVGSTLMNAGSSRSHSIFTISLEQIEINPTPGQKAPGIRKGKLNLVDLAGSERQNKTGAAGDRLKEATKINLSLSALGNVISALVDGKTKHIPYRDSKLTRLLQDSLGGNTKTLMIACISPADYNYDETLSTLRYASRAKNISNKPKINEDPKDAMLREYQEEILKLKKMLESSQTPASFSEDNTRWLESEKAKLQQEYELETNHLKEEHAAQQREKEELVRDMERLKTHYDNQLKDLSTLGANNNRLSTMNLNEAHSAFGSVPKDIQLEVQNRIEMIKNALIGGERANDVQLKEKHHKKKLAAQGRLSALAHALSRVEQSEDRNLLQVHYSTIQQELKVKNESLKSYRQKIRALEREVSDLQSEFQLDRADYLETIRRLERNMKFYQQILEMALPILRKDGKYWDPDEIMRTSSWNDDLRTWKLPEDSMNSFKLPLAIAAPTQSSSTPALSSLCRRSTFTPFSRVNEYRHPLIIASSKKRQEVFRLLPMTSIRYHKQTKSHNVDDFLVQEIFSASAPSDQSQRLILDNASDEFDAYAVEQGLDHTMDNNEVIASNYFRPRRNVELIHQRKGFNNWKDFTVRNRRSPQFSNNPSTETTTTSTQQRNLNSSWMSLSSAVSCNNNNRVLSSWLPQNHQSMSKSWCGLTGHLPLATSSHMLETPLRDHAIIGNSGMGLRRLQPPLPRERQVLNIFPSPLTPCLSNSSVDSNSIPESSAATKTNYFLPRIHQSKTPLIVLAQQQRRPQRASALKTQCHF